MPIGCFCDIYIVPEDDRMANVSKDKVDITESDIIRALQVNTDSNNRMTIGELAIELYGKNGISGNTDDKAKRYRRKYDRLMLIRKKLEVLFDDGKGVIGIFDPIKNKEAGESFIFPDKPSYFQHYEVYYKQNFTKAEAFMIYSGLYNQESIPSIKVEHIVDKLVKNTSNNEFKEMAKNISLESDHKSIVENFRNDPEIVMKNIELILNSRLY